MPGKRAWHPSRVTLKCHSRQVRCSVLHSKNLHDLEPVEGTWRAHQVLLAEVRTNHEHLRSSPSTTAGPVQPLGVRSTIIGQIAAWPAPERRVPDAPEDLASC
jgi:hypothetical protein